MCVKPKEYHWFCAFYRCNQPLVFCFSSTAFCFEQWRRRLRCFFRNFSARFFEVSRGPFRNLFLVGRPTARCPEVGLDFWSLRCPEVELEIRGRKRAKAGPVRRRQKVKIMKKNHTSFFFHYLLVSATPKMSKIDLPCGFWKRDAQTATQKTPTARRKST